MGKISHVPAGAQGHYQSEHRDKTGRLIYAEHDRKHEWMNNYDYWRGAWCEANRNAPAPEDFRAGKLTWQAIQFALKLKIMEVTRHGTDSVSN